MKFTDLSLRAEIQQAIAEFGYTEPTPIQAEAIPLILEGHDVIGSAQTGTGKTAAFALPVLERLGQHGACRCLALGPTRELAAQVEENFRIYSKYLDLRVTLLHGGVGYGEQKSGLKEGTDIIVATPGRLLDHVEQRTADLSKVEFLILDEVDRMLDMGFIDDVRRIIRLCPKKRQTLLFSATVPDAIKSLAKWALREPREIAVNKTLSPAETVRHVIYPVGSLQKFDLLIALMESMDLRSTIIFCRMKRGADRISRWLIEHGYPVATLHSDLPQKERTKALAKFKSGELPILVATDIASRGLDIADVSHVVNYDVPQHAEDYVHRIGRTGRARREGEAFTLECPEERSAVAAIENFIKMPIPKVTLEGFPYRYDPMAGNGAPRVRKRNRGYSSTR